MLTGKKFEAEIKAACIEQDIDFTRLKDAGWQGEQTQRRFTSKNICDCILFKGGVILFCEVKHRKGALRFDEITQLGELEKKWKPSKGVFSGVLAMLKGKIFYINTNNIIAMQNRIGKKSFNYTDAADWGIEVEMIIPKGKRKLRPNLNQIMKTFQ
jgi:penicillin-binding protein-related factor A (putative recombinase)